MEDVLNRPDVYTANEDHRIAIRAANGLSNRFPRRDASEIYGDPAPYDPLVADRTTSSSGLITANLSFGIDEGGPNFQEVRHLFGKKFVRVASFQFPEGGSLPATASHGNEAWKYEFSGKNTSKSITLDFNRAGELSSVLIGIKKKTNISRSVVAFE